MFPESYIVWMMWEITTWSPRPTVGNGRVLEYEYIYIANAPVTRRGEAAVPFRTPDVV